MNTLPTANLGFRAMSTDVVVTLVGGEPALLDWARERVSELEQRWSRFVPGSELGRINESAGAPVQVSTDTVTAVRAACAAWVFTEGLFDPTVHDSLIRLGYDDTIEQLAQRDPAEAPTSIVEIPAPGCSGIVHDERSGTVLVPAGVRLDLGGIGKGLAADLVATGLVERGAAGAMVDIGGDVRVTGAAPTAGTWSIDVTDPRTDQVLTTIELDDGGVATSSTLHRRWRSGQRSRHHLVDPRSGTCTATGVVGVAVVAGTAAWADALSKVPFVDPSTTQCFGPSSGIVMFDDGTCATVGPKRLTPRLAA
jgi:thiamine biosynthesis lipoprotein